MYSIDHQILQLQTVLGHLQREFAFAELWERQEGRKPY